MSQKNIQFNLFRLGAKILVCLFCFILGCTLSITLMNNLDCSLKQHTESELATPKTQPKQPLTREKRINASLVVLIVSSPDNLHKRHSLRRTWLTLIDHSVTKYYFVIGSQKLSDEVEGKIITEQDHYSDLLILPNVEEGYHLLSTKVLESFIWINENVNFNHALKVDDDTFVDIRRFTRKLALYTNVKHLYWGYFNGRAKVQQTGKWKETQWNLCDRYLPYARGGGYVLSKTLIEYLAKNAGLLSIYKSEDVSVGTWLAPLNISRVHDSQFDTEWTSRGCLNQFLITHPHDDSTMLKLHENLGTKGRLCETEVKNRNSYEYNWNVLPSLCCKKSE